MIERILPAQVAVAESFQDPAEAVLFPAERAMIATATARRRAEFTTGRACAREALAKLGVPPGPIAADRGGAPVWPDGVTGSITHCTGYRAAAVARSAQFQAIGIDGEPHQVLPDGVADHIALQAERGMLTLFGRRWPDTYWDRVLWCAKEASFKAWLPGLGAWPGYQRFLISIDPVGGTFTGALPDPDQDSSAAEVTCTGRWLVSDGLVLAAVVAPALRGCCSAEGGQRLADPLARPVPAAGRGRQ